MQGDSIEAAITVDAEPKDASKALWAKCSKCGHCWAAAYYPIDLDLIAKILKKHSNCPKCNGRGVVAKQENGVLLEPV